MTVDAGDGRCKHCGTPLANGTAFVCTGSGGGQMRLPSYCPSQACQDARDQAAIDRAIAAGVIAP